MLNFFRTSVLLAALTVGGVLVYATAPRGTATPNFAIRLLA